MHHASEMHHTRHKSDVDTDAKTRAEGELKLKGLTPKTEPGIDAPFVALSVEDQKLIHTSNAEGWKKINEDLRAHKEEAIKKAQELDIQKREEELKLLKVKRFDETASKPEFLCVVNGCGETKAPGQGYHCAFHSKAS